ncbi:hypothetical protein I302_101822 [Kwoniella bestiolae CBS 10118]|uniref:Uncharacterized protein n=1 Tax=Kwoniella bestiolae CBS 10118 TaxID=1296100 RepID=A0A1B9GDC2_9TREE|nr:hypothetical protein I302_00502 [Kwoniella bestiolae CBS 10118]OCF29011.1 hypothetical protein I302_00502 [Kwoniella bestiolae CBS 10118]
MAKENPSVPQKRAAPISASAFAFSLTPQNKKPKPNNAFSSTPLSSSQTPSRIKSEWTTPKPPSFTLPPKLSQSQTPRPKTQVSNDQDEPERKLLDSIPKPKPVETPLRATTSLKPLTAFTTPLTPQIQLGDTGASSSKALRPLLERIGDVTPVKGKEKELDAEAKPRFALHETLLSGRTTGDLLSKRKTALKDEDEGVGVSPRGKRIAKWSGNGPPPPSVHLANLLSSSNASLHLFYTSMQHLLYPSQRGNSSVVRSRQTTGQNTTLTPIQHIQNSASIRLKIVQTISRPTHNSTIFWCEPLKWHNASIPNQQLPIIFQPLPGECPKLGVDPRLLALKMRDDGEKEWQVGVWAWTEVEMPLGVDKLNQEGEDDGEDVKTVTALIVSRYLIVDQPIV